jgi:hypothetical protein
LPWSRQKTKKTRLLSSFCCRCCSFPVVPESDSDWKPEGVPRNRKKIGFSEWCRISAHFANKPSKENEGIMDAGDGHDGFVKKLYLKQPYDDNYVPASFLNQMRSNG